MRCVGERHWKRAEPHRQWLSADVTEVNMKDEGYTFREVGLGDTHVRKKGSDSLRRIVQMISSVSCRPGWILQDHHRTMPKGMEGGDRGNVSICAGRSYGAGGRSSE